MSKQGMIGMDLAAQEMLGVGETLTDEQWHLPPRMQRKLPQAFAGPLGLDLTGPAGTRVAVSFDGAAITVTPGTDSTFDPRAIITSSTDDFLAWSTKRLPWQQLISVEGDRDEAARFLNALNLV
jgi:hypothetical protein